jgi:hypothetical protein
MREVQWREDSLVPMQDPPAHGGGLRGRWVKTWQYLIHRFGLWDLQRTINISRTSDLKEPGYETNQGIYPLHTPDLED